VAKAASLLSKANLDKATRNYHRADDLYQKKLDRTPQHHRQDHREVARANYQSSLARLRRRRAPQPVSHQLSKTTIYSPMDGIISVLNNEVGERVVGTGTYAGTEVMRIADLSHMESA